KNIASNLKKAVGEIRRQPILYFTVKAESRLNSQFSKPSLYNTFLFLLPTVSNFLSTLVYPGLNDNRQMLFSKAASSNPVLFPLLAAASAHVQEKRSLHQVSLPAEFPQAPFEDQGSYKIRESLRPYQTHSH